MPLLSSLAHYDCTWHNESVSACCGASGHKRFKSGSLEWDNHTSLSWKSTYFYVLIYQGSCLPATSLLSFKILHNINDSLNDAVGVSATISFNDIWKLVSRKSKKTLRTLTCSVEFIWKILPSLSALWKCPLLLAEAFVTTGHSWCFCLLTGEDWCSLTCHKFLWMSGFTRQPHDHSWWTLV